MVGDDTMKENEATFKYSVPIVECEVIEKDESNNPTKVKVGGTCLVPTVSRNGNKYSINNIKENDGKTVKFFAQEHGELALENVVGKVSLTEAEGSLKYEGVLRNTKKHPDVVEHAINKEIDVSIDARAYGKKVEENEGKKVYTWDKIDVRALCGVGVGGLAENTMEYAIAESFGSEPIETSENTNEHEVNNMDESEQLKSKIAEMEKLIKEKDEVIAAKEKETFANIVNEIKAVNATIKESDLEGKPVSELKTILEYEKKMKATKESEDEGDGEVDGDAPEENDKNKAGILINESDDTITMNDAKYRELYTPDPALL